jgi:hypothetical protein
MIVTSGRTRFGIVLFILASGVSYVGTHAQVRRDGFTSATNQEVAAARSATAKYHDLAQAEADGYVNINLYEPGEGFHWVNPALIDGTFDPTKPEVLLYAPVPGESHLKLVAVEYLVPLQEPRPAGFTGPADVWREDVEEFGLWELTVWIWEHNPHGLFTYLNPRVP